MLEATGETTRLVDGHELSYGFRDARAFAAARETIRIAAAGLAADRSAYHRAVSAGFGLWLDFNWRTKGWNTADVEQNYFSPAQFEASLRAAVEQSDEIVWIYTEKPRWWSEDGVEIDLPAYYIDAVRRARRALIEN
jgi:hypothetical protein